MSDKITDENLDALMNSSDEKSVENTDKKPAGGTGSPDGYKRNKSGQFGKGNKGRPVGIPTKTTIEMKAFLMEFCTNVAEDLYDVWEDLGPKDKAALFMHIVKYVMPADSATVSDGQEITINLVEAKPIQNAIEDVEQIKENSNKPE